MRSHSSRRNERAGAGGRREYGQSWEIAAALWDNPRSFEEIVDYFHAYLRWFGFLLGRRRSRLHGRMIDGIRSTLHVLVERGWVVETGGRYSLTDRGRTEAEKVLRDMRRTRELLARLIKPQTASRLTLAVHLALALLKLPAGILTGSVGLLNDGVDTLLDALSSMLVLLGIRWMREREANVVLVVIMLATGGFTFFQAARRFLVPSVPEVDLFAFSAAILSALLCAGLWAYQRAVGLRTGIMALITQSVDSRNHVLVAIGVTAGLVASALDLGLIDTIVGLLIALLILKSAGELLLETIRAWGGEEADLSRYRPALLDRLDAFRRRQIADWMMYMIRTQRAATPDRLRQEAAKALDFSHHAVLRELGAHARRSTAEQIDGVISALVDEGLILSEPEGLRLTDRGEERIRTRLSSVRGGLRALTVGLGGSEGG